MPTKTCPLFRSRSSGRRLSVRNSPQEILVRNVRPTGCGGYASLVAMPIHPPSPLQFPTAHNSSPNPTPGSAQGISPGRAGRRIVALDRMPEGKTVRRKLSQPAKCKGSYALGQAIARRRIPERGRVVGVLNVDGHVGRPSWNKHHSHSLGQPRRLAAPATTDQAPSRCSSAYVNCTSCRIRVWSRS